MDKLLLGLHQKQLAAAGLQRAQQHAVYAGRGTRHGVRRGGALQHMEQEERGDGVAGAVDRQRQPRGAQRVQPVRAGAEQVETVRRRLPRAQAGDQNQARPRVAHARAQRQRRLRGRLRGGAVQPRQAAQLELVGREYVAGRHRLAREEPGDAGAHVHARPVIADHRVATPQRRRVVRAQPVGGMRDDAGRLRVADIARQQRVAAAQHAARLQPVHQRAQRGRRRGGPAEAAIARMVGELHRVDGQTSAPRRCSGNTAALLPTWPKVTWDWMLSMFMAPPHRQAFRGR